MPRPIFHVLLACAVLMSAASAQVPNDDHTGAITVPLGTVSGSNLGATSSTLIGSNPHGHDADIFLRHIVGASGYLTIDTCGSSIDTVLTVWNGNAYDGTDASLVEVASDDDACGFLTSSTTLIAAAGDVLYIQIAGYDGLQGQIVASVAVAPPPPTPPVNDETGGAIVLNTWENQGFTNLNATDTTTPIGTCGFADSNDVWFTYVAQNTGPLEINTFSTTSTMDTVLSVYDGSAYPFLSELACNDNSPGPVIPVQSSVTVNVSQGDLLYVRVAGWLHLFGTFDINVKPLVSLAVTSPYGPGTLDVAISGAEPNTFCVTPISLAATAFPFGPFHGLDLDLPAVLGQVALGAPFFGVVDSSGNYNYALTTPSLPTGLVLYTNTVIVDPLTLSAIQEGTPMMHTIQ